MTGEQVTALLAQRVMGWGVAPDRFLIGHRQWMPRWRFDPLKKVEDALRLLETASPDRYEIRQERPGVFSVAVLVGRQVGEARGDDKARTISIAVARAVGIEVEA